MLLVFADAGAKSLQGDTVIVAEPITDTIKRKAYRSEKPHSPHKATLLALFLPSSGQIYNRQYWKLPILYGGIGATIYGLNWNTTYYNKYRKAFIDYSLYLRAKEEDPEFPYPENASWDKLYIRGGVDKFTSSQQERFKKLLENKKIRYKRDRDLLYIVMAGIYIIQVVDACVFAHFYDFEIDEDLTFNIQPAYSPVNGGMVGLSLTLNF